METSTFNFNYISDLVFFRKADIEKLANKDGIVNLNHLAESIKEIEEAKESVRESRLARREFSDLINGWVMTGLGKEIGYANVHQFILA